jgi:LacI family transcriptional regulator
MKEKISTIRDIAQQAGVSTTTVSDIMTGRSDRFLKETMDRVLDTAAKLNYRRHIGASAMRSKRFNTLGLVLSQSPEWESMLIEGVESATSHLNLGLMLVRISNNVEDLPTVVKNFQVDGLIADWTISSVLSKAIAKYNVPTIWVNNDQHGPENCIWPDDYSSGKIATEHLISLGHKDIAFLFIPQSTHPSQEMRLAGYRQAMSEARYAPRVIRCDCTDNPKDLRQQPEYFKNRYSHPELWVQLEQGGRPTAFVCYNTLAAMELYNACFRRKIYIQDQFAVVSCDEMLEHAEKAVPSITTVLVDHAEMGRMAVNMLLERIKNAGLSLPSRVLPVRVNRRESSFRPIPND